MKGISTRLEKGTLIALTGNDNSKNVFLDFLGGKLESCQKKANFKMYLDNIEIRNLSKIKNLIGYVEKEDIMEERVTPI